MMTVFLGYGVRVYHNHRHYRHHRQKNNEKKVGTLFSANFQWNSPFWKQQKWRLWRLWRWFWDRSRTYPANSVISVISVTIVTQEQRGGLGDTPEMCMWMTTCYASKTCLPLKRWQSNSMLIQIRIFPRVNQPLIHWKYLTRRSESMIDSLCPQKRNVAKIQPIVPEWISLDSFKNLDSKKWISSDSRWN